MSILNRFPTLRPSLNLDFANTGLLDPRVTFARASTATYFDQLGVLRSAAAGVPRFDYDPVTLQARGLLIEEQRTNSIRNNTMVGAAAGTPGTAPTNWTLANPSDGITQQIVGTGTENGITYIDIKYSGTASSNSFKIVRFEAINNIAASSGQTWTAATYMRIAAGSTANINLEHVVVGYTAAGAFAELTNTPPALTSSLTRFFTTRTLNNATTAFVSSYFAFSFSSGAAIDITLRIGLPQLELGAFATSVIPTSGTALTRNADVASMTGTNFSSWWGGTENTIFAQASALDLQSSGGIFKFIIEGGASGDFRAFSLNFLNNRIDIENRLATATGIGTVRGAANLTANIPAKFAAAFTATEIAGAQNGVIGTVVGNSTARMPVDRVVIGSRTGSSSFLNGHIQRIAYYKYRLSNAQLQELTRT